jgi:hypothetical protein
VASAGVMLHAGAMGDERGCHAVTLSTAPPIAQHCNKSSGQVAGHVPPPSCM